MDSEKQQALENYRRSLMMHKQADANVRRSKFCCAVHSGTARIACYLAVYIDILVAHTLCVTVREKDKELNALYEKSEDDLKALQSVGQVP